MDLQTLIDMELPVIQAPMAGVQDATLALAVSAAGGLGSLPCALLGPDRLEEALQRLAAASRPVNLNFFCHAMGDPDPASEQHWREALTPYYREFGIEPPAPTSGGTRRPIDGQTVELLERYRPRVLSFHFGLPAPPLLSRLTASPSIASYDQRPGPTMFESSW